MHHSNNAGLHTPSTVLLSCCRFMRLPLVDGFARIVYLQGLLVAHELRERLRPAWLPKEEAPSSTKILEAITHRSCADSIDFERYELLGDAFLKFASANHLYSTRTEGADEGSLSLELHRRVSNGTLWRCAVVRLSFLFHCECMFA